MGRLDGKVAIITGAARGTGEATARMFADEGARILLADVLDERGEAVAREIGDAASYQHLDVSEESDWQEAVHLACQRFGKLDVLVNNAAILDVRSISETSTETFKKILAVNQSVLLA